SYVFTARHQEPLHATVVTKDGNGLALVGDSGYGKSTLAAAFLRAGYRLLTDDLLVLHGTATGFEAQPALPRLKLFPRPARALLPLRARSRMNAATPTTVYAL